MKSSLPKHLPLVLLLLLLVFGERASLAQTNEFHPEQFNDEPWVAEVSCRGNRKTEGQATLHDRQVRLCLNFQEKMLQPTSDGATNSSDLYILSYTNKGQPNLSEIHIDRVLAEEHPGLVIGEVIALGPARDSALSSLRVFKVRIEVNSSARSAYYPITVKIASGADEAKVDFRLPILAPNSTSIALENKQNALIDCWAGSNCSPLELQLRNKLPYNITVSNISISSDDLLENKPQGEYQLEVENNSTPRDLNLVMKAKPITLRRVFSGFGTPKVTMRVDYKDEYGRTLFTESAANLEIRPNMLVIAVFLVLGAIIGTFVRIDLGRLQRANIISKRQRIVVTITTFVSGLIVCLVALFANIKIVVLSDENSYSAWDPKVLFLTALIATVSGLPILYAYLKVPRQDGNTAPANAGNPVNPNP